MKRLIALTLAVLFSLSFGCGEGKKPTEKNDSTRNSKTDDTPKETIDYATLNKDDFGKIYGKVLYDGKPFKPQEIKVNDKCKKCKSHVDEGNRLYNETLVVKDKKVKNAVVYIKQGLEQYRFPQQGGSVLLDQEMCTFKPHVVALMVGQTLKAKNSDMSCEHNVNIKTNRNGDMNQVQKGGQVNSLVFERYEKEPIQVG